MKKIILAGILGAVIAFVWSAVIHTNPLTGMMGLSMLNTKEDAVMAAVKENVPQPGLYFFPGMDMETKTKVALFDKLIVYLSRHFTLVNMGQHAASAMENPKMSKRPMPA